MDQEKMQKELPVEPPEDQNIKKFENTPDLIKFGQNQIEAESKLAAALQEQRIPNAFGRVYTALVSLSPEEARRVVQAVMVLIEPGPNVDKTKPTPRHDAETIRRDTVIGPGYTGKPHGPYVPRGPGGDGGNPGGY